MIRLDDHKKNSSIEHALIIDGIQNECYRQLNYRLCALRRDYSIILPRFTTVSFERLSMFVKKIKYFYLCVNIIEESTTQCDQKYGKNMVANYQSI